MRKNKFFMKLTALAAAIAVIAVTPVTTINQPEYDATAEAITADAAKEYEIIAYDHRSSRTVGVTAENIAIDFGGIEGMELSTSGTKLNYNFYTHVLNAKRDKYDFPTRTYIATMQVKSGKDIKIASETDITLAQTGKTLSYDCSKLKDGIYKIFTQSRINLLSFGWFEVKSGKPTLIRVCLKQGADKINTAITEMTNATRDLKPEDNLDLSKITYPTSGRNNKPVHTQLWIEKANEILAQTQINGIPLDGKDYSDATKTYLFTQWIIDNMAYDYIRADADASRMTIMVDKNGTQAYQDKSLYSYYNHVGVCWDFTNILAIMCRSQNIPCTSVDDNDTDHTRNLVYVNDEWTMFDVTPLTKYDCRTWDTDKKNWKNTYDKNAWKQWGEPNGRSEYIGLCIWTEYNATHLDWNK